MTLLSARQLVVASHLVQIVIPIPDEKPTSRYAGGNPLKLDTWDSSGASEARAIGAFRLPFVLPLSWEDSRPKEVAIWLGGPLHVVSTRPQSHLLTGSLRETPNLFRMSKTGLKTVVVDDWCAAGTTIGVANKTISADTLVLTPSSASDCGLVRLDRMHSPLIEQGAFRWSCDEGERVARMCVDEESSCLVLLKFNLLPEGSLKWTISLYDLH
jgi:hypothetical protein